MNFLTLILCSLVLFSAVMVIVAQNPLHSVLFLVLSFFMSSLLLFIFENEFLALFFLIIYLGSITILFLFVVMMLDIKFKDLQVNKLYFPAGVLIGTIVLAEVYRSFSVIFSKNTNYTDVEHNLYFNWYDSADSLGDLQVIGQVFYTHYVLQILMAGLILYVAVIGVAFLTVRSAHEKRLKRDQSICRQLSRNNVL